MKLQYRRLVLLIGDLLICLAAVFLAPLLRNLSLFRPGFYLDLLGIFLPCILIWIFVFYALELYDFLAMRKLTIMIRSVITAFWINTALTIAFFYVLSPYSRMTPKTQLLISTLLAHAGILAWRQSWVRVLSARILIHRVVFLGDSPLIQRLRQDVRKQPYLGYQEIRLSPSDSLEENLEHWVPRASPGDDSRPQADLFVIDESIPYSDMPRFQALFSQAVGTGVQTIMTDLDFYEIIYDKIPPKRAARPHWLLSNVLSTRRQSYAPIKRFVDLVAATLGLIILFPLFLIICLISWMLQRGNPFYSQKRFGYRGKEFYIWKFRTMVDGADKDGPLWRVPKRDARVTRWGSLLRRFRLDELPQLWNVFMGDMSLVGPRPEWLEEVRVLEKEVAYYHLRHLCKPGMTGWAQIRFRATNSPSDSLEKLHYDLFYIKNMSLALDVGILLKTLHKVMRRE